MQLSQCLHGVITIKFVVDVEIMDEFRIHSKHSFGEFGVDRCRFEQTDMQRSLSDTSSLVQLPTYHLTCATVTWNVQ